jgi:tetratricopeptide (TPR) repeat protein
MYRDEFDDGFDEGADILELIEHFENTIAVGSQVYFEEEDLNRIMHYYEVRMQMQLLEKVIDFALTQNPYSSDFIIRKAEFLLQNKKYDEAHAWLDKAMLFDKNEIDIYLVRADIFTETNKPGEALAVLETALSMAGDDDIGYIYVEISHVYELMEDYPRALKALLKAVELQSDKIDVLEDLTHLIDMTEEYETSITLHKNLIDKDPYNWMAWYNLGRAYMGLGLFEKAIEAFEYSAAINENFEYAYRDAADAYFRMDQPEKAINMFLTAQQYAPEFDDYSYRIGICFEKLENYKTARFHYRKATRQDPFNDAAFFRIGETYRIEERYEAALVNYKKALRLDEQNEHYLSTIIALYQSMDNTTEAITYLYALVHARADVLAYWIELIQAIYQNAVYDEAADVCNEAIMRCGNYAEFHYLKSIMLFKSGKHRESLTALENALIKDFARQNILLETDETYYYHPKVQQLIELYTK